MPTNMSSLTIGTAAKVLDASDVDAADRQRITGPVGWVHPHVRDLDGLSGLRHARQWRVGPHAGNSAVAQGVDPDLWQVAVERSVAEAITVT